MKWGLE